MMQILSASHDKHLARMRGLEDVASFLMTRVLACCFAYVCCLAMTRVLKYPHCVTVMFASRRVPRLGD